MARRRPKQARRAKSATLGKGGKAPLNIEQALNMAVRHHGAGRMAKAERLYGQILQTEPDSPVALHLLGVLVHQAGDNERAVELITRALEIKPDYADAYSNLGSVLQEMGRLNDALDNFHKAVALAPALAEAHNNVGNALRALGRAEEALESYHMAVAIRPDYAEACNNHGIALRDLGRLEEALASYRQALSIRPDDADVHGNIGAVLQELGRGDEAVASYRQALELRPDDATAQANLTGLYITRPGDTDRALAESRKSLELLRRSEFGETPQDAQIARYMHSGVPRFRLKHDLQQADYLASKDYDVADLDAFRETGHAILERQEGEVGTVDGAAETVRLNRDEVRSMMPYLQADLVYQIPALSGSALNPEKDWVEVQAAYLESANEIIHIDDFLSPDALTAMREYCLVSKIWLKEYANKYLGTFSEQGFITPLHLQIARELQAKLPQIFGAHPIGKFWAFKYDSTLGKGINVHADFALVNLNFWITPDEYNLDPKSGGLKVYDVPSPANWRFQAYNEEKEEIYKFLEQNDANAVHVHHRCNRAALFNSAYFHETEEIRFQEGYEARRINITYLFGER